VHHVYRRAQVCRELLQNSKFHYVINVANANIRNG